MLAFPLIFSLYTNVLVKEEEPPIWMIDLLCRYREGGASGQGNATPTERVVLCGQSKRGAVYKLILCS